MKLIAKRLSIALVCVAAASSFLCNTASAQLPRPTYFSLENNNSHLCLSLTATVTYDYPGNGMQLIQEPCDGRQGEVFYQGDPTTDGGTGLASSTLASDYYCCSLYVVGVQGGVMQNGASVIMWSEDPTKYGVPGSVNNQGWGLVQWNLNDPAPPDPNDPPCYLIYNAGGGGGNFVMGVAYGSFDAGAPVVIWNWADDPNYPFLANSDQYWCAITPGQPSPLS